jgi:lipopolysaccharide export system protein LptA
MIKNNMKSLWLAIVLVFSTQTGWSQIGKGGVPSVPRRESAAKSSEQTAKVLEKAKADASAETAKRDAEKAADRGQIDKLVEKAKQTQSTLATDAPKKDESKLQQVLSEVAPEGKSIVAQSAAAPATTAPDAASVAKQAGSVKRTAAVAAGSAPQPQPLPATPLNPATKKEPERTVITSQGEAFFDSKQSMGVFTDDVVVVHPQFHMTADVLEIYMNKEEKKPATDAKADAKAPDSPKPDGGGMAVGDNNINKAIAKGRKVVIQKLSETGEMQIGICRHATYIGATGEIVMRDYPQVQRGKSVIIGTSPTTVMTIKPSGELITQGPNKVDIIQEGDKKASQPSASAQTPKPQGAQ